MAIDFDAEAVARDSEVQAAAAKAVTKAEITAKAKERLEQIAASGGLAVEEAPTPASKGFRAFVAPVDKFYRVLVKAGEPYLVKDASVADGERMARRNGDIFLEFQDGIVVLDPTKPDDQVRIQWCESHPEKCRDISDPFTEAWAYMREMQEETARDGSRLPASINLEALLRGDARGGKVPHDAVSRARTQKERMESEG